MQKIPPQGTSQGSTDLSALFKEVHSISGPLIRGQLLILSTSHQAKTQAESTAQAKGCSRDAHRGRQVSGRTGLGVTGPFQ